MNKNSTFNTPPANWPMVVLDDGEYGSADDLYTFDHGDLTEAQWVHVGELDGYDRRRYIEACVDNDPLEQAYILGEDI